MTTFARCGLTCSGRVLAVLGIGSVVSTQAGAGTITTMASYNFAAHGTSYTLYNQLNPALTPLNEVDMIFQGEASIYAFSFANTSSQVVTFHGTVLLFGGALPSGPVVITDSFTETLNPFQSVLVTASGSYNYFQRDVATSINSLSEYIGTGQLAPDPVPIYTSARSDNPNISIVQLNGSFTSNSGTETIIYYYGTSFGPIHEPASIIMMGIGLAAAAATAWSRHAA